MTAGMINHLLGLSIVITILVVTAPGDFSGFSFPAEPWLYLGGAIGVIGVAAGAILVRRLGVLLLSLGMVAGQLLGALLLELLVPTGSTPLQVSTFVGIGLTLVAVGVTSMDAMRKKSPESAKRAEPQKAGARVRGAGTGDEAPA